MDQAREILHLYMCSLLLDCRKENLMVNEQPGGHRGPPLQPRWILLRRRNLREVRSIPKSPYRLNWYFWARGALFRAKDEEPCR